MQLAFYAPMKPPDHPVPSGDRNIARALVAALKDAGYGVQLACRLRSRDGAGDAQRQQQIISEAEAEVARLTDAGRSAGWRGWVTYHNYYKAPDLIGPPVAAALGIPYVQIESTRAQKRLTGPWAPFAQAAEAATDQADVVFYFTERDAGTLRRDAPAGQTLIHLRPFLNRATLPPQTAGNGPILSVGMMREGDKQASYRIIAQTLALMPDEGWTIDIAGDGPARPQIEAMMRPFGGRVRFLGKLEGDALGHAYARAGLLFWPGVNEALGMVYLEAQAAGLAVVAQDRPGMREMLAPAPYPAVEEGPQGLCTMLQHYLKEAPLRLAAGKAARDFVARGHLLPRAADTLTQGLARLGITP